VLGLQTPGLQIFLPLDSDTLLMFVDSDVYSGPSSGSLVFDVLHRSDVSQLNALQLHHSLNAVYFAERNSAEYVWDLWNTHAPSIVPPRSDFHIREGWLVDDTPVDKVCHSFQPQINLTLDLSFLECTPIRAADYECRHRSPDLVEEHEKRCLDGEESDILEPY